MKKFDLTWGESVAVRQAFLEHTTCLPLTTGFSELENMNYTPFAGEENLIQHAARIIKRQTGQTYKHIFLTNGASGGCTIALRAHKHMGYDTMITNPPPYFPLYPSMAYAADLAHTTEKECFSDWKDSNVVLLDSPHNPTGLHQGVPSWAMNCSVIWDAVYHNNVYSAILPGAPAHDVMVGSFSKLTGLNGIRLGWIATNNDLYADEIGKLLAPEYCGLSKPSVVVLNALLDQFNVDPGYWWTAFETAARYKLDLNREIWSELERFFAGTPVSANGMFYYAPMDSACKRLFEKAGVLWQSGTKCGTDDDFGRFNIGQDTKLVIDAMRAVLKADKI